MTRANLAPGQSDTSWLKIERHGDGVLLTLRRGLGQHNIVRRIGRGCAKKLVEQLARKRQPSRQFLRLELETGIGLLVEHKPFDRVYLSVESTSTQRKLVACIEGNQRREIASFIDAIRETTDPIQQNAIQPQTFLLSVWTEDEASPF